MASFANLNLFLSKIVFLSSLKNDFIHLSLTLYSLYIALTSFSINSYGYSCLRALSMKYVRIS